MELARDAGGNCSRVSGAASRRATAPGLAPGCRARKSWSGLPFAWGSRTRDGRRPGRSRSMRLIETSLMITALPARTYGSGADDCPWAGGLIRARARGPDPAADSDRTRRRPCRPDGGPRTARVWYRARCTIIALGKFGPSCEGSNPSARADARRPAATPGRQGPGGCSGAGDSEQSCEKAPEQGWSLLLSREVAI